MTLAWPGRTRPTQWLLIILLAAAAALTYWLPHRGMGPSAPRIQPPAHANYYARDARMTVTGANGKPLYRIRAREALHYPNNWTELHTVHVTYLTAAGPPWHLRADQARMPPSQQQIDLSGHVVAHGSLSSGAPIVLNAPSMTVFPDSKRLQSDARVDLDSAARHVDAVGMRADLNTHEVEFLSDVHSTYSP